MVDTKIKNTISYSCKQNKNFIYILWRETNDSLQCPSMFTSCVCLFASFFFYLNEWKILFRLNNFYIYLNFNSGRLIFFLIYFIPTLSKDKPKIAIYLINIYFYTWTKFHINRKTKNYKYFIISYLHESHNSIEFNIDHTSLYLSTCKYFPRLLCWIELKKEASVLTDQITFW